MGWGGGGRGGWQAAGYAAGRGGAGYGAGPKGGGGGGGGTRMPWSSVHVADAKDSLGIEALSAQIPEEWVDKKHGGRRGRDRMHSTVLLKMSEPAHLERLRRLAQGSEPFRLEIRELFCQRVDRIQDAEVYCIGVGLASPGLRALKDAWCAEEPEDRRKIHVPYDGEGHVSLAYIQAQFQPQAQEFVDDHVEVFTEGRSLLVDHITYQDEWGKEHQLKLGGAGDGDGPRAAKGARRGAGPGEPVEIDGSILEGGGQILRMSSSYSALFGVPIHISKIRAGRSKPGLAAQHLESFRLVRDVVAGSLTQDAIGSNEVTLRPGELAPGSFSADPGTAGAITLMVQASLVPLLFSGGESNCDLRGGTDVGFSPPLDFLRNVLRPMMALMGGDFSVECQQRGVFPKGGGHVQLWVPGIKEPLKAIDLSTRGEVARVTAVLHATRPGGTEEQAAREAVRRRIGAMASQVQVDFEVIACAGGVGKLWLDIVVETSTGALFHGGGEPIDLPGAKGGGRGKSFRSWADAAAHCADAACKLLEAQLATGAAVDLHLADQLVLPASLAAGTSRLLLAEPSMHFRTAIHIAQMFAPEVQVREEKQGALFLFEIEGIAYGSPAERSRADPEARGSSASAGAPAAAPAVKANVAGQMQMPASWGRPSAAVAAAANEEVVKLKAGSMSRAHPTQMQEFRNDMQQLGDFVHVKVVVDNAQDRLVLQGGPQERQEAHKELQQVLAFYKWPIV